MKIYASVIIVIIVSIVISAIVIIFALLIIVIFITITIIVVVVVVTIDFFLRTSIHERPKLQQNRLQLLLFCTFLQTSTNVIQTIHVIAAVRFVKIHQEVITVPVKKVSN